LFLLIKLCSGLFVQELDKLEAVYRNEYNSIWYDSRDKEKLDEIGEAVSAKLPVPFVVYDEKILIEFLRLLDIENINYEMKSVSEGKEILVSKEDRAVTSEAFHYALMALDNVYNK